MKTPAHDALFKVAFTDLDEAEALLRSALPAEVEEALEWPTLALAPASFVDEVLDARHADLLFTVRLAGRPAYIHVLLEHRSTPDADMPYRALRYIVRTWDRHRQEPGQAHGPLPLVLPVVVYHGPRPWPARRNLADRVAIPAGLRPVLGDAVPRFSFFLDDVGAARAESLGARGLRTFGELTLRLMGRLPYSKDLRRWTPLFLRLLAADNGLQRFVAVLQYVHEVSDLPVRDLKPWARSLGPSAERTTMGWIDEARAEGRQQGRAEGRQQGRAEGRQQGRDLGATETLLRLLELKFGPLTDETERRVRQGSTSDRAAWTERLLTGDSLAAVLGETEPR